MKQMPSKTKAPALSPGQEHTKTEAEKAYDPQKAYCEFEIKG